MKSYCEYGYNQYGLVNSLRGLVVGDVIGRETLAKFTVETGLVKWTAYFVGSELNYRICKISYLKNAR